MKKCLATILVLAGLLLIYTPAQAEPVKLQATVLSMTGAPTFTDDKQTGQALKLGQMLDTGAKIMTGSGATVRLMLADGSSLWLGENTDLTLNELTKDGEKQTTLFSVIKGLIKASVQKLTLGSRFELNTPHGVAAVKGTQYEAEVDERQTEIRVKEGRVWLEDPKHERRLEIGERKAGRAYRNGMDDKTRDLTAREIEKIERAGEFIRRLKYSLGDTWNDLASLRADQRQEKWREQLKDADSFKLADSEAKVDFQLRRVLTDVHGVRVRMLDSLLRPAPDTVQFVNYTRRENRTDALSALRQYNKALPDRLADAPDRDKWIWDHQPQWWTIYNKVEMLNSFGDDLLIESRYFDPVTPFNVGLKPVYVLPVSLLNIEANGTVMERYERYTNTAILPTGIPANLGVGKIVPVGNLPNDIGAGAAISSNLCLVAGIAYTSSFSDIVDKVQNPGSGDWSWVTRRTYNDANKSFIQLKSWAIDENGSVINTNTLIKNRTLYDIYLDILFKPYVELEATSSEFGGRSIDVVSKMLYWMVISKTADSL